MSGEGPEEDFNKDRAELFEVLGHPTRIKILQSLSRSPLSFSDLKIRAEVGSNGLLSFHLGKLTGLVKVVEGSYVLTDEGREALRILAKSPIVIKSVEERNAKAFKMTTIVLAIALVCLLGLSYFPHPEPNLPDVSVGVEYRFDSDPVRMRVEIQNHVAGEAVEWFDVKMNGSTVYALQGLSVASNGDYWSVYKDISLPDGEYLVWTVTLGFSDGMSLSHTRIWGPGNFSDYYNQTSGEGTLSITPIYYSNIPADYHDSSWVENMTR